MTVKPERRVSWFTAKHISKTVIMIDKGIFLACVGPAGIGKSTSFNALQQEYGDIISVTPKTTTRPIRQGETDTKAGVPLARFQSMVSAGEVVMEHQPFGPDGHWYGYDVADLRAGEGKLNLIEPNIEFQLPRFKEIFGGNALVIALTTNNPGYIYRNLVERGTESPENIAKRLKAAESVMNMIDTRRQEGYIDEVLTLDWSNRDKMVPAMLAIAGRRISQMALR